jgi:DNA-binding MarR family transcriptional regulator
MESRLARELRQGKPFANLEEEVFLNVLRTGDALLQREVEVLRTEELGFAQYNVLRILRGAGERGASCGDIAERMVNRDPDLTRLLDRLEGRGLVERSRLSTDRRVVVAKITPKGRALLGRLDGRVADTHREQLRHMTRERLESLAELLVLARTPTGAQNR